MKEKVAFNESDFAVLEILDDPILFGEFIRSADEELEEGKGWHYDNYQRKMLIDSGHYVSIATGRTTGKTAGMETKIIQMAISNMFKRASANEILLVVQKNAILHL